VLLCFGQWGHAGGVQAGVLRDLVPLVLASGPEECEAASTGAKTTNRDGRAARPPMYLSAATLQHTHSGRAALAPTVHRRGPVFGGGTCTM
jgi:hypothetical protein